MVNFNNIILGHTENEAQGHGNKLHNELVIKDITKHSTEAEHDRKLSYPGFFYQQILSFHPEEGNNFYYD
jgi:hypothetical protein